ncbi:MAG: iron-sulfur cluster assembly accessory protein [Nitrospirota bacterium]|nr:iron-sulfur cluster assembly accessory protein [Nitrospirota bacterium]
MITISDVAAGKIKEIMKAEGMPQAGLRIFSGGGGCGCSGPQYEIAIDDKAGQGDTVVENQGAKLYVDSETATALAEAELSFISDERGEGFVINFPKGAPQAGGCNCGPDTASGGGSCGSGGGSKGGGCGCGC